MPAIVGTVRSAPCVSVNSDGSQQWLGDYRLGSVGDVMDRGAVLVAGAGFTLAPEGQHLILTSPPVGPVIADVSSLPEMAPATLRQAVGEVFSRIGKTAWASSDATEIDAQTGYAGVGFYAAGGVTVREALSQILGAYTADWWQDETGFFASPAS